MRLSIRLWTSSLVLNLAACSSHSPRTQFQVLPAAGSTLPVHLDPTGDVGPESPSIQETPSEEVVATPAIDPTLSLVYREIELEWTSDIVGGSGDVTGTATGTLSDTLLGVRYMPNPDEYGDGGFWEILTRELGDDQGLSLGGGLIGRRSLSATDRFGVVVPYSLLLNFSYLSGEVEVIDTGSGAVVDHADSTSLNLGTEVTVGLGAQARVVMTSVGFFLKAEWGTWSLDEYEYIEGSWHGVNIGPYVGLDFGGVEVPVQGSLRLYLNDLDGVQVNLGFRL